MEIGLIGKAIAGVILGGGLIWLFWRKLAQGESRAVEIAGRKAQQDIEAEADAAERAIREAAEAAKRKTGPVDPAEWKFVILFGLLALLPGCADVKSFGVSRWTPIDVPAELEYSPEEQRALAEFATANPELARKIVNQAQAMRAAITEYNKRAWDVNAKQLKALGYSDPEIERLNGKKP